MGGSAFLYWPGQGDDGLDSAPWFEQSDSKNWADWIAAVRADADAMRVIGRLKLEALVAYTTEGMQDDEVAWTTPEELERAASQASKLATDRAPDLRPLLKLYAQVAAPHDDPEEILDNMIEDVIEHMSHDLADVEKMARWAQQQRLPKVAMVVNW